MPDYFKAFQARAIYDFSDGGIRNNFQKDRDRILYSKPFRRLSGKTQVFFAETDDHIRNRLTHTLEVNQIANTIANHLNLNETLAEAIALGHDLGHTPFGHVGEKTLNLIMNGKVPNVNNKIGIKKIKNGYAGFKHNLQGVRILKDLSRNYATGEYGLDISGKTLYGIANHSNLKYNDLSVDFYRKYGNILNDTCNFSFESVVVRDSDEIAQRHHDVEDALSLDLFPHALILNEINSIFEIESSGKEHHKFLLKRAKGDFVNKTDLIAIYSKIVVELYVSEYLKNMKKIFDVLTRSDFKKTNYDLYDYIYNIADFEVGFSKEFNKKDKKFQAFLKDIVLNSQQAQMMDGKGKYIIIKLFQAYLTNPQQMPDKTIVTFFKNLCKVKGIDDNGNEPISSHVRSYIKNLHKKKDLKKDFEYMSFVYKGTSISIRVYDYKIILMRTITDYVSNMTDSYALKQYEKLYGTAY